MAALRRAIDRAELDPEVFAAVRAQAMSVFGPSADTLYLRFRSSTNAEDLETFSGAGLYDSRTGCIADDLDSDTAGPSHCLTAEHRAALEARRTRLMAEFEEHPERTWIPVILEDLEGDLSDEKPMSRALRRVWRSLWNLAAFEERAYYGIDHASVFMGVAVVPTMTMERAESVILTNVGVSDSGAPITRVVTQQGEIGVVDPEDPSAVAEIMHIEGLGATSRFEVLQRSSESPAADLWGPADRVALGRMLELVQAHFERDVYPSRRPLRLDIEVDVDRLGNPVFKQARPYLGASL